MTIKLDPTGTGEWLDCVSLSDISLPEDWATDAYVGLTAATGQLSGEQNFAWELTKISKLQNVPRSLSRHILTLHTVCIRIADVRNGPNNSLHQRIH